MADFTLEQVRELEDKVINFIHPVHMTIQLIPQRGLTDKDRDMMLKQLNAAVAYIRSLRPLKHRWR